MGVCFGPKCHFPDGVLERSKTFYVVDADVVDGRRYIPRLALTITITMPQYFTLRRINNVSSQLVPLRYQRLLPQEKKVPYNKLTFLSCSASKTTLPTTEQGTTQLTFEEAS
eukprot:scaffold14295_cov161-Skeletonema_marinoi.AAC.3